MHQTQKLVAMGIRTVDPRISEDSGLETLKLAALQLGVSEAEAEGLLRENANDMDLAVLAVRRAQRHTSTLGAR